MADITEAAKIADRRARNAIAARNYRARIKAERLGVPVPAHAVRQQPARYRPPRVHGAVERAQASARQQRERRERLLSQLPDVRNPRVKLRPQEKTERGLPERKTRAGRIRQAEAIRERAAAERIQTVGRERQKQLRGELDYGAQSDRLQETLSKRQQREFKKYSNIIASGSYQATAILFDHAGGQQEYSAAIERLLASPESRDVEEGLSMLAALAERAQSAATMYAPRAIGRIEV